VDTRIVRTRKDVQMPSRKRRGFPPEQKADAVHLVREVGSISQVVHDLDLTDSARDPKAQLPWSEARLFLRDLSTEVTDDDLADFRKWAVAWPPGAQTDRVEINGIGSDGIYEFDPLVNPLGKILESEHIEAVRELEYASALALVDLADVAGACYKDARVQYFDQELFQRKDLAAGEKVSSGLPKFVGTYNYSMNLSHGGWGVEIRFDSAPFPELEWALGEIGGIKAKRIASVQSYIESLDLPVIEEG